MLEPLTDSKVRILEHKKRQKKAKMDNVERLDSKYSDVSERKEQLFNINAYINHGNNLKLF